MNYQKLPAGCGEVSFDAPLLSLANELYQTVLRRDAPVPRIELCFVAVNRLMDQFRPAMRFTFHEPLKKTEFTLPLYGEEDGLFSHVKGEILFFTAKRT